MDENITIGQIKDVKAELAKISTIGEWKALGRQIKKKFNLNTDREAIDLLNYAKNYTE